MLPTVDPSVMIEEVRVGYVRYVSPSQRWEVHGTCNNCGDCLVGAVIDGEEVSTIERAAELAAAYAGPDCPVTPLFHGCPDGQLQIRNVEKL